VPIRFIGIGEGIDDLRPFLARDFAAPCSIRMELEFIARAPMISFSQVRKSYRGGTRHCGELTFAIETGELVFITGRSGAGKSTLLKLIPAIERRPAAPCW